MSSLLFSSRQKIVKNRALRDERAREKWGEDKKSERGSLLFVSFTPHPSRFFLSTLDSRRSARGKEETIRSLMEEVRNVVISIKQSHPLSPPTPSQSLPTFPPAPWVESSVLMISHQRAVENSSLFIARHAPYVEVNGIIRFESKP